MAVSMIKNPYANYFANHSLTELDYFLAVTVTTDNQIRRAATEARRRLVKVNLRTFVRSIAA